MKTILSFLFATALAACGVETATTAAAGAEIKRREMEQAKKTMEKAAQKIEQNTQELLQRAADTDKSKD